MVNVARMSYCRGKLSTKFVKGKSELLLHTPDKFTGKLDKDFPLWVTLLLYKHRLSFNM